MGVSCTGISDGLMKIMDGQVNARGSGSAEEASVRIRLLDDRSSLCTEHKC